MTWCECLAPVFQALSQCLTAAANYIDAITPAPPAPSPSQAATTTGLPHAAKPAVEPKPAKYPPVTKPA